MNSVRWSAPAALIAAMCVATPASALNLGQSPEYSQTAADLEKGQIFTTSGLVCDRPSEIDAVITLARNGEPLKNALDQINAGSETPRCIVGRMLVAQYVDRSRTFEVNEETFLVHQVQVVGIAVRTPRGVVPMRLKQPMEQYVVSTDNTRPA